MQREPYDPAWIIKFDDAEMPDEFFAEAGATEAALRRFEAVRLTYNCHLFCRVAVG